MKNYVICGIQQMGIGVVNLEEAWKWYRRQFGMDCRIFEEEAEANLMLPYTGGQPRNRHAVLAFNLQSGGGFEIWQYKGREPLKIKEEIRIGDLGIMTCKIKTKSVSEAFAALQKNGVEVLNPPVAGPSGLQSFFVRDPYGNLFQLVEGNEWFMDENKVTGGTYGAVIGVSDIEKSRIVYSDILGYDRVIYDSTGRFPDFASLAGGEYECRRILLRRSEPLAGPFSRILGQNEIELVCRTEKPGKKIYEGRLWGDPGFIHLCYDMRGMDNLGEYCRIKGFPFTVDSRKGREGASFDMGEAAGHFSYIEDPDGTLIEFVETHKLPVLKKIGWYLDLKNRDPHKPLPDWILKTLRFSRVKV
ncbi:MAG: VOC family protein [Bacteroidales bacterium]|nr:VOC family protein [Bacteroidales bacterium]